MFKRYRAFFKTGMMNMLAYKFAVFTWLFVCILSLSCTFFLWTAVYNNSPVDVINGFTFKGIIAYTIFVNIFGFALGSSETQDVITDEIQNGQIAMSLIKPISYRLRFTFSALGTLTASNIITGIPLMTAATIIFCLNGFMEFPGFKTFLITLLFFFVAQILAKLLSDSIDYIFGLISFYTMASFGLFQMKEVIVNFLSGMLIPIAFFPEWAAKIINYLPFVGVAQNPVLIYLGKMGFKEAAFSLLMQVVWIVILEIFAHFFYNAAIKKITIQGG